MEHFIYSLNATMPVFFVIVLGYVFRKTDLVNDNFVQVADKFNYKVTLPVLLFCNISTMDIYSLFDLKFFLFCMIASASFFFAVWAGAHIFIKDKHIIGSFVQGSCRGSAAILGIAFIQNIYGNAGLAPLMIAACAPVYNIMSVFVLTLESDQKDLNFAKNMKRAFINVAKNPIIIAVLLGMLTALSGVEFPAMFNKTLDNLSVIATPLALLTIGASFEGAKALTKLKPTIAATLIKLVLLPAVFLPIAIFMGFRNHELVSILIMVGAPTTATSYIMAKNLQNDSVLTSSIIVLTTLFSSVSITLCIFILRCIGVI